MSDTSSENVIEAEVDVSTDQVKLAFKEFLLAAYPLSMEHYTAVFHELAKALHEAALETIRLTEHTPEALDIDSLLQSAELGKLFESEGKVLYQACRLALWAKVDKETGKHASPSGREFRFQSGVRTTTKIDQKRLKAEIPEVYKEYSATTTSAPDTPGVLYL